MAQHKRATSYGQAIYVVSVLLQDYTALYCSHNTTSALQKHLHRQHVWQGYGLWLCCSRGVAQYAHGVVLGGWRGQVRGTGTNELSPLFSVWSWEGAVCVVWGYTWKAGFLVEHKVSKQWETLWVKIKELQLTIEHCVGP